ncbi:MAG: multiheme c-type cytochrome [Bacteroidota bacterium]|nr:multiheme c-type cytochrome [Bacteroidota bacterium]
MKTLTYPLRTVAVFFISTVIILSGCSENKDNGSPAFSQDYVVFAWNDLGMHCLNPSYDKAVILPPYNNLMAQVVLRGNPPKIVTSGITVEYRILGNTTSYDKRGYGGFWDNVNALFGLASLQHDVGLTGNRLSGTMQAATGHFEATGIPVTPVNDMGVWDPLQVAELTVKDGAGKTLATTRATVPTSDDINCAKCHGNDAFNDVLQKHDSEEGTSLMQAKPVLCAKCHGSPALGQTGRGTAGTYLSEAIHGFHADKGASCYDCHPGNTTKCNRSEKHTAADGNCTRCHGTMEQVASSTKTGRVPWVNEPSCSSCHAGVTDAGSTAALYRNSTGHGNMMCTACHGSPHAMVPSLKDADNYQAMQYQPYSKSPKTLGSCGTCHSSSRGENEIEDYAEVHGGSNPEKENGCYICHTSVQANTAKWPHAFTWQNSN